MATATKQPIIVTYQVICWTEAAAKALIWKLYGYSKPKQSFAAEELLARVGRVRVRVGPSSSGELRDYVFVVDTVQRQAVTVARKDGQPVDDRTRELLEGTA